MRLLRRGEHCEHVAVDAGSGVIGPPEGFVADGTWRRVEIPLMKMLAAQINELAIWRRANMSQGRWLGIEATKSEGMSPALTKTLQRIKEKTCAYV